MRRLRHSLGILFLSAVGALVGLLWVGTDGVVALDIDQADRWAFNDGVGWIDFGYPPGDVDMCPIEADGYASSSATIISLNCRDFGICSTSNYKVTRSGAEYRGWAWNDHIGWISFNCADIGVCGTSNYKITLGANGYLHGWAWNDMVGWISVNCDEPGTCASSTYRIKVLGGYPPEGYLVSATFDTGVSAGVTFNSIMWRGNQPLGTVVKLQFASSNCSNGATNPPTCTIGGFTYIGPDGTSLTYYNPGAPDQPIPLSATYHSNQRYFRYKVVLNPDAAGTLTPEVNQVIVNYSS